MAPNDNADPRPDPSDAETSAEFVTLLGWLLELSGLDADEAEERARRNGADLEPGAFAAALARREELPAADLAAALVRASGGPPEEWMTIHALLRDDGKGISSPPSTHDATGGSAESDEPDVARPVGQPEPPSATRPAPLTEGSHLSAQELLSGPPTAPVGGSSDTEPDESPTDGPAEGSAEGPTEGPAEPEPEEDLAPGPPPDDFVPAPVYLATSPSPVLPPQEEPPGGAEAERRPPQYVHPQPPVPAPAVAAAPYPAVPLSAELISMGPPTGPPTAMGSAMGGSTTQPPRWGKQIQRAGLLAVTSALVLVVAATMLLWREGTGTSSDRAQGASQTAGAESSPQVTPSTSAPPTASPTASPTKRARGTSGIVGKGSGTLAPTSPATMPRVDGRSGSSHDPVRALLNLQAFIRGFGNGDPSVCGRYATESFADRAYGSMRGCREDAEQVSERYRPEEVQAMRTVMVTRGTAANGYVLVRFSDLRWSSGNMTSETLQDQFLLGTAGGTWKIVY